MLPSAGVSAGTGKIIERLFAVLDDDQGMSNVRLLERLPKQKGVVLVVLGIKNDLVWGNHIGACFKIQKGVRGMKEVRPHPARVV